MIFIERKPYYEDRITKTREFSSKTTKKLENSKKSHKKVIWQKKKESTRTEGWGQHVARSQKYPFKLILKEAGPKEI